MKLSEIKISLEDLAKFAASYDNKGKLRYQENIYEGKEFFESLYRNVFNCEEIPEEVKKIINYE